MGFVLQHTFEITAGIIIFFMILIGINSEMDALYFSIFGAIVLFIIDKIQRKQDQEPTN